LLVLALLEEEPAVSVPLRRLVLGGPYGGLGVLRRLDGGLLAALLLQLAAGALPLGGEAQGALGLGEQLLRRLAVARVHLLHRLGQLPPVLLLLVGLLEQV